MESNSASLRSVLITDSALDSLSLYYQQSPDHARRVDELVDSLRQASVRGRVLRLSGAERPVWQCALDDENCFYLTVGQGAGCIEERIAYFGPPLPDDSASYRQLLYLTGEAPHYALPDDVRLEDVRADAQLPPAPERRLTHSVTLDDYLTLAGHDLPHQEMDDLRDRPYRLFQSVRAPIDLPARLSPKQREKLTKPRPMFLQGVAGSGKTTLLAHFAHQELVRSRNQAKILIVVYTDSLRAFIRRILSSLKALDDVDASRIEIYTWRELCDMLASRLELHPIRWAHDTQFANFVRGVRIAEPATGDVDLIPELQELIRSTLKGGSEDANTTLIARQAFLDIPDLAIDAFLERSKAFEIAEQYQYFLRSRGLYDDLDAAHVLYTYRHEQTMPKFDYVLVDETQDYALAQVRLMAALAEKPSGLFFAGDMNQVVYRTQFDWQRVRTAVYQVFKQPPPQKDTLPYNYRNPLSVRKIGQALLALRPGAQENDENLEGLSNQPASPVPIRIRGSRDDAVWIMEQLAAQIGSLGVIQEREQHFEVEGIEFQRSFTPQSVKGLEFNVVCLVGFNGLYRELAANAKQKLPEREKVLRCTEVYVSVTRTRGQLLLLDLRGEGDGLWDSAPFRELASAIDDREEVVKLVAARYKLTTRKEWNIWAADFESQARFDSAGECWERAGEPERAAMAYERHGLLSKAFALYKAIGNTAAAARLAEELGQFTEAAGLYAKAGQLARAADCCTRIGNEIAAATAYERIAEASGSREDWAIAARHYRKAKKLHDAARCHERAELWDEAARDWTAASSLLEAARCHERAGKHGPARECEAQHWEAQRDFIKAAELWTSLQNFGKAAQCQEEAGRLDDAQRLFAAAGNLVDSARVLRSLSRYEEAAEHFERLGMLDRAAEFYESAGDWAAAARCWNDEGSPQRAVLCHEKAGNWVEVGHYRRSEGRYRKAAEAYERGAAHALAAEMWMLDHDLRKAARNSELAGDWISAAEQWDSAGDPQNAARCYRKAGIEPPPRGEGVEPDEPPVAEPSLPAFRIEHMPAADALRARVSDDGVRVPLDDLIREFLKKSSNLQTWEYAIADTPENRELITVLRTAKHSDAPLIESTARRLLQKLRDPEADVSANEAIHTVRSIIETIAGSNAHALEIQENPGAFACLFEFAKRHDLAAPLWEKTGEWASAAHCYQKAGRRDKVRQLCLTVDDSESAAALLRAGGLHIEAALRWIDCNMFMAAAADLDLGGANRLATIAKAVGYDSTGQAANAWAVWNAIGTPYTKDMLRTAVEALVYGSKRAAVKAASEKQSRSFLDHLFAFLRFLGLRG